jgi:uncharacterized SAM-binding protein YcdF (DUF218 family)
MSADAGGAAQSRRRRIAGITAAVVLLLGTLAVVQHAVLLTWVGSLLLAQDDLVQADVVVPLAGGNFDREIEAADILRGGRASRLVLTLEPEDSTRRYLLERNIQLPTAEETRLRVLAALGVPRERITIIRQPVTSTLDEARFVGAWAAQAGVRNVIVVTSPQHTARSKYVFGRYAATPNTRIIVRASSLGEFRTDSWWKSRATLREGIFELQKLVAYRLRY